MSNLAPTHCGITSQCSGGPAGSFSRSNAGAAPAGGADRPHVIGLNVINIVDEIRNAFPAGAPPSRPITGHRCDECDAVDRLMGGRTWQDVASDFPQYCDDTFPLLTPEAKVYYLPAYMCYEVVSPGGMAGISVSSAFERGDFAPRQFNEHQRAAIAHWIEQYYRSESGGVIPESVTEQWNVPPTPPAV